MLTLVERQWKCVVADENLITVSFFSFLRLAADHKYDSPHNSGTSHLVLLFLFSFHRPIRFHTPALLHTSVLSL